MKILHVTRQFYPTSGGIPNAIWHLSKYLISKGHESHVIALNRLFQEERSYLNPHEVIDGIVVDRVGYFGSRRYAIAPQVISYVKDCDLIHLHSSDFFLDYLALLKPIHRKPIVLNTHGLYFHTPFGYKIKRLYFNTATRLALNQISFVICDSRNDMDLLEPITTKEKIALIPNGIHFKHMIRESDNDRDHNMLLTVGVLAENKRIDLLIQALALVVKEKPSVKLVVVGPDRGLLDTLQNLCHTLRLDRNIHFTGRISNEALEYYLSKAIIWLSASEYEGFGIALLEAMAAGCFPIVQPINSFREILGENTKDFYADFNNPEHAAETILGALSKPKDTRRQLINQLREKASIYSWENIGSKIVNIYDQVISTSN